MKAISQIHLMLLVLIIMGSCAGAGSGLSPRISPGTDAPEAGINTQLMLVPVVMQPQEPIELGFKFFADCAPNNLLSYLTELRLVAYDSADLTRDASSIESSLPHNRVSLSTTPNAVFSPDTESLDGIGGLAYCMYRFALSGYDQRTTVGLSWDERPRQSLYFLGLGNQERNAWDWYAGEIDDVVTVGSFGDYINSDGSLLLAIVVMGADEAVLRSITIGQQEFRALGAELPGPMENEPPPVCIGGALPASVDLSSGMPPVRDQYSFNSATAFGFGDSAFNYILGQLYGSWDFSDPFNLVSPKHLYLESSEDNPPLNDNRPLEDVAVHLVADGVATELTVPYVNVMNIDYPLRAANEAGLLRPDYTERIPCNTIPGIESVKQVLAEQGLPVVVGTMIDSSFTSIGNDPNDIWKLNGYGLGAHCMCIVGYDDSKQAFKVRNSWGDTWGISGYFWMSYDTFLNPMAAVCCYTISDSYDAQVEEYFLGGVANNTPPPGMVRASDGTHSDFIRVTWNKVPGAGEYWVYRQNKDTVVATLSDVDSYDDPVTGDGSYTYWVRGIFSGTPGDLSMPDSGFLQQGLTIGNVAPLSGIAGNNATFHVNTVGDEPVSYAWDFDGGATPGTSALASPTVELSATPGYYPCSVTVYTNGGSVTRNFTLTVMDYNTPPVASLTADQLYGIGPLMVNLDASASDDPDGNNANLSFHWDWDNDGTTDYIGGSTVSHEYSCEDSAESYTCRVLVIDEAGMADSATVVITVVPPGMMTFQHSWGGGYSDQALKIGKADNGCRYAIGIAQLLHNTTPLWYATMLRYDADGDFEWSKRYRFGSSDYATFPDDGWIMPDGTMYVCGGSDAPVISGNGDDAFVAKFDPDGNKLADWIGGGTGLDRTTDMFIDSQGNVFLFGVTNSFGAGGNDFLLIKLNSNLAMQHVLVLGTSANDQPWSGGHHIYITNDGHIFVVGISRMWDANGDAIVVYIPPDLNPGGIGAYCWSTSAEEDFCSITGDGFGNLIIGGHCLESPAVSRDWLIAMVTPDLNSGAASLQWDYLYGDSSIDWLAGLATDNNGQIYVTGYSGDTQPQYCIDFLKILYNGDLMMNRQWNGNLRNRSDACSIDSDGNIMIAAGGQTAQGYLVPGTYVKRDITGSWDQVSIGAVLDPSGFSTGTPNGSVSTATGVQDTGGGGDYDMLMLEFSPVF